MGAEIVCAEDESLVFRNDCYDCGRDISCDQCDDNAKFVVKACNAFPELLENNRKLTEKLKNASSLAWTEKGDLPTVVKAAIDEMGYIEGEPAYQIAERLKAALESAGEL